MRLLLTGYPGWLTERFVETYKDYQNTFSSIRCLVHPMSPLVEDRQLETVTGDLRDSGSLKAAVENVDVILHAAGVLHVKRIKDYYTINRDGTENLIKAASEAGVKKFIYISTNAAQGFCEGRGHELDGSEACHPESHYGISKFQGEEIVRKYQVEGKIDTVIIRPAMFYGPPVPIRHLDIYKRIQSGRFPVFGSGNYLRSITFIDNLMQGIHLAIEKDAANGNTYYIADREVPTLNEIILTMGEALGVNVKIVKLPSFLANVAALMDKTISATGLYWMLPHIVGESCKNIACRITKAESDLGYDPKISYKEGYNKTIQWCKEHHLV